MNSSSVAPVASLVTAEPYDTTKDIEFFGVPQESATLALRAGDFAVFAPGDGHRPSLHLDGPHVSRKVVVKVSVAYRDRQRAAKLSRVPEPSREAASLRHPAWPWLLAIGLLLYLADLFLRRSPWVRRRLGG
jgi:hypothetical protein